MIKSEPERQFSAWFEAFFCRVRLPPSSPTSTGYSPFLPFLCCCASHLCSVSVWVRRSSASSAVLPPSSWGASAAAYSANAGASDSCPATPAPSTSPFMAADRRPPGPSARCGAGEQRFTSYQCRALQGGERDGKREPRKKEEKEKERKRKQRKKRKKKGK